MTEEVERLQEAQDKAQSLLAERHIKVTVVGDLALFVCTYGSKSRVTVRFDKVK